LLQADTFADNHRQIEKEADNKHDLTHVHGTTLCAFTSNECTASRQHRRREYEGAMLAGQLRRFSLLWRVAVYLASVDRSKVDPTMIVARLATFASGRSSGLCHSQ
jgi:hypothetical protein